MDTGKLISTALRSMRRIVAVCAVMAAATAECAAQSGDFGLWTSLGVEKKINKKWSVEAEGEFRTRNDARPADRWSLGVSTGYKLTPWLKADVGYVFLRDNNREDISLHADGSYNNWRPSFWGSRHRATASLTASVAAGAWKLSLRERWQYTYRPEHTTDRYDFDNSQWEDKTIKGKGRNVLRSRLQVDYNIPKCKVDPYASIETYNAWAVQKVRYTVGADLKIRKRHVVGAYYRYQSLYDDDTDNDAHVIGVEYKFKF